MLKGLELKEAVEKFKEMIYKQNGNIKKIARKPKKETKKKFWN